MGKKQKTSPLRNVKEREKSTMLSHTRKGKGREGKGDSHPSRGMLIIKLVTGDTPFPPLPPSHTPIDNTLTSYRISSQEIKKKVSSHVIIKMCIVLLLSVAFHKLGALVWLGVISCVIACAAFRPSPAISRRP